MTDRYREETKRFEAFDANGNSFTIIETTEFIEVSNRGGTQTIPGKKSLRTTDGQPVNRHVKGKYQLPLLNNLDLHSDNPDAP